MFLDNSTANAPEYYSYPGKQEDCKKLRPILTAIVATLLYVVMLAALVGVCMIIVLLSGKNPIDFLDSFRGGYSTMDIYTLEGVLFSMGNVVLMLPALFLAMKITKERPVKTLTSSRGGWNMNYFKKGLLIALVINALPQIIIAAASGGFSHLNLKYTIPGFILFIILVPFQCIAEEYIFRGYISQTFCTWFKQPLIAMIISALLFTVMHGYNSVGQISIFITGMAISLVAWYTKGMEAGCALHIVNNFFSILLSGIGAVPLSSDQDMNDLFIMMAINLIFLALVIILDKKKGWFTT